LTDIAVREAGERVMWIILREAGMPEAPDRRPERVEGAMPRENQAIDQEVVEVAKDEPFRPAGCADERAEEIRMESFSTQSVGGSRARSDDEVRGGQWDLDSIVYDFVDYIRV
jgi:hypothetical protein